MTALWEGYLDRSDNPLGDMLVEEKFHPAF
jgi:hypothetical protein